MRATDLTIAEPCEVEWDAMTGTATRRFCGDCQKHVHNLSEMTERRARALLAEASCDAELCVRYRRDANGDIVFKPDPSLDRRLAAQLAGVKRLVASAALALPLLAGVGGVAAAQDTEKPLPEVIEQGGLDIQGGVRPVPQPPEGRVVVKPKEGSLDPEVARSNRWALDLVKRAMDQMEEETDDAPDEVTTTPVVTPPPPIKPDPPEVHIMGRIQAPEQIVVTPPRLKRSL